MNFDPVKEQREHHLKMLGIMSMVAMVVVIAAMVWFFTEWVGFDGRNFNPTTDENTLDINYGFNDTAYVFTPLAVICFIVYLVGGSILLSEDIQVDNKSLVLSTAIIPAVLGCILLLNSGVSFQSYYRSKKTFTDTTKEAAAVNLRAEKVPYLDAAIVSLIPGIVNILIFAAMLAYYYLAVDKIQDKRPAPQSPIRYVPPDYLARGSARVNPPNSRRVRFG